MLWFLLDKHQIGSMPVRAAWTVLGQAFRVQDLHINQKKGQKTNDEA